MFRDSNRYEQNLVGNNRIFFYTLLLVRFRHLCILLNAKDIYCALSEILQQEDDLKFASLMVNNLNMILLTSSELFELRQKLKDLANEVSQFKSVLLLVESMC